MKAKPGDRIILAAPTIDAPLRDGEVLETRGPDGGPPFVVRWADGHTGLIFPGPGAVLRVGTVAAPAPAAAASAAATAEAPAEAGRDAQVTAPEGVRHIRDWQVRISIFESEGETDARVVLLADSPTHLVARGHSKLGPSDAAVPEIGDEVAVARALRRLADQLLEAATTDIESVTGEHDVTLRPR